MQEGGKILSITENKNINFKGMFDAIKKIKNKLSSSGKKP